MDKNNQMESLTELAISLDITSRLAVMALASTQSEEFICNAMEGIKCDLREHYEPSTVDEIIAQYKKSILDMKLLIGDQP